jgi:maleate isomerase
MTKWYARFGWVVPSWNTVTEFEVAQLSGPGVSNHFTRIEHLADTPEAFGRMAAAAPDAATLLSHAGVDAICYACTSGSFYRGPEYDRDLARKLSQVTGRPVVTMADSVVQAAHHLGWERVSVAAPYETWLMELLVSFLEAAGLGVLKWRGLGHQANVLYPPDGLVMSCGNFRTLDSIEEIERRLGRPVVTSIQASVWNLHRVAGHAAVHHGAGRLLHPQLADSDSPSANGVLAPVTVGEEAR